MSTRYIELNSLYRDRNLWPLASEFEIPISQTGTNNKTNSVDPVSNAMPIFSWTSNNLIVGGGSSINAPAKIENYNPLQYSSDQGVFIISTTVRLQQLFNYYNGLIITDTSGFNNIYRRISSYYYLGSYVKTGTTYYRAQISIYSPFPDSFAYGNSISITDPTDFSDFSVPLIFVPSGQFQENAYVNYILYNETINQYRPILNYDNTTNMITLDTSGSSTSTNSSGPIDGTWSTTDNFSLRKEKPTIPNLGDANPVITSVVGNSITISYTPSLSSVLNYYKNYFIRVLPYGDTNTTPTDPYYEYDPTPSNNKGFRILSYTPNSPTDATFTISNPFLTSPNVGASIEIVPFSYDNLNPFVYTGSLVSQQEMVCYEVRLSNLIIPNYVLLSGNGGRAAYYPFVYVELSNVSSTGARLKNTIYSNNPHTTNVIFKLNIYDIQNPLNTPFVRISGDNVTQTIKFKPNDNLYFKLTLPNGDLFKTGLVEKYSPEAPNLFAQITAIFSFRRL